MINSKLKPVIGVVGGIGSGKSLAAAEMAAMGLRLIDADRIGHELLGDRAVREAIVDRWGQGVLGDDGSVNRRALGEIVFADAAELEALNAIMHPAMRLEIARQIEQARSDAAAAGAVVDAAVLFEAGWDDLCTHTILVDAPEELRQARAAKRGWSRQQWMRREKSQLPLDIKRQRCYRVVDNSSSVSRLREQIRRIVTEIIQAAE